MISFDDHLLDFCILRDWTMINDLDFANLLEIESHLPVFFLPYLAPISVTIFDAFEPTVPLVAWKSRSPACFEPAKECFEGFIKPAKHLLHAGCIEQSVGFWFFLSFVSKVRPLFGIMNPFLGFPKN